MAYTAYRTWVLNAPVTSAQMNEQVRDNGLLTAPAVLTVAGDMLYASAPNAPVRLAIGAVNRVLASTGSAPNWVTALTLTALTVQGNIAYTGTSSKLIQPLTSWLVRDSGDLNTNLAITDAGAITVRSTVSGVTTLTAATISATTSASIVALATSGTSIAASTGIRATGLISGSGGNAVELELSGGTGYINAYTRSGAAYIPLVIAAAGITFSATTAGAQIWKMHETGGHLIAITDNVTDIGASGATRPRRIYVGTEIIVPTATVTTLAVTNTIAAAGGIRATGAITGTGLGAVELEYATGTSTGYVNSYDRTNALFKALEVQSLGLTFKPTGGAAKWKMESVSGHLLTGTDNQVDIGASGATRPRRIYVATEVVTPLLTATNITMTGDLAVGRLDLSSAAGTILGGSSAVTIRNSADTFDNLVIADGGNVTFRTGAALTGIGALTMSGVLTAGNMNGAIITGTAMAITVTRTDDNAVAISGTITGTVTGTSAGYRNTVAFVGDGTTGELTGYEGSSSITVNATKTLDRFSQVQLTGVAKGGTGALTLHSIIHLATAPSGGTTNRYISTDAAGCYLTTGGVWTDASHEFTDDGSRWKIPLDEPIDSIPLLRAIQIHRYDLTDKVSREDRLGHIGPFAEELHRVSPLLSRDGRGVSATALASFAILASQDQQAQIDALQAQIDALQAQVTPYDA